MRRLVAALTSLPMIIGACEGGVETAVTIEAFVFRPRTIRVSPGTAVTFTNRDDIPHTVTSGETGQQGVPGVFPAVPARPDGRFDLSLDAAGASATVTIAAPGTYPYFCAIHAGMTGRIVMH